GRAGRRVQGTAGTGQAAVQPTAPDPGSLGGDEVEESLGDAAPAADAVDDAAGGAPEGDTLTATIDELTGDLQRLQAEYVNYRKRVDRDRELVAENATYKVLAPIVEVLDTIDRAREHGDLSEDLKQVADQLERVVTAQGLSKFGEPGEAFDPQLHEALSHLGADASVEVTTVKVLAKAGYRIGDRVVRAAQVLVVDPE
ncbi:MAG: nucleotide exchange factor GrpE, partial [Nocardioides sp.]